MNTIMKMANWKAILDQICEIALDPQYKDRPDLMMLKLAFCPTVKDFRENKRTVMGPKKGSETVMELLRLIERWRVYQNYHAEYAEELHKILTKYDACLVYYSEPNVETPLGEKSAPPLGEEVTATEGDVVIDQDTMRIIRDALQCAVALCDTPIARRRLGIDPDDEHLQHLRAGLSELQSREHLFSGEAQRQIDPA